MLKTLTFAFLLLLLPTLALAQGEKPSHELFGMTYSPYMALTLSRVGLDSGEWSTGFKGGLEIDAGGTFIGLEYHLHDILTSAEKEVYPWDGTFEVSAGVYF